VLFDNQWGEVDTAGEPGIKPFVDLTTTLKSGDIALHKLNAAQVAGTPPSSYVHAPVLTQQQLAPIVQQAINNWIGAGISPRQAAMLRNVQVSITDLPGAFIGMSSPDGVWIARNAAGFGWFVDPTPATGGEFGKGLSRVRFTALPGSPPFGQVDL